MRRHYHSEHPDQEAEVDQLKLELGKKGKPTPAPEGQAEVRRVVIGTQPASPEPTPPAPPSPPSPPEDKCQEAGSKRKQAEALAAPLVPEIPPCLSPLAATPPREENPEVPKQKTTDDDAISISSMPPLELDPQFASVPCSHSVTVEVDPPRQNPKKRSAGHPVPRRPSRSPDRSAKRSTEPDRHARRPRSPNESKEPDRNPATTAPVRSLHLEMPERRVPKSAVIVERVSTRTYVDGVCIAKEERERSYLRDVYVNCTYALTDAKRH